MVMLADHRARWAGLALGFLLGLLLVWLLAPTETLTGQADARTTSLRDLPAVAATESHDRPEWLYDLQADPAPPADPDLPAEPAPATGLADTR